MYDCPISLSYKDKEIFLRERFRNKKKDNIAIVTVGGPGSGKTTVKNDTLLRLGLNINDFVNIDRDEITTSLFQNKRECAEQVKRINHQSFKNAYLEKYNLIFDGTGKNFNKNYKDVIQLLKEHGYTIYLCIVHNDIDIALERIRLRTLETGRWIPIKTIKSFYEMIDPYIIDYLNIPCDHVDGIFLYDNTDILRLELITQCTPSGEKNIHHIDSIFLCCSLILFFLFLLFLFFILFPIVQHLPHIFQGKSFRSFFIPIFF
jgi:predicted ABC-type ATPase